MLTNAPIEGLAPIMFILTTLVRNLGQTQKLWTNIIPHIDGLPPNTEHYINLDTSSNGIYMYTL